MKARACWLYGKFSFFINDETHALQAVELVFNCLKDESLVVKVFGGIALKRLSKLKVAKGVLETGIDQVMGAYLEAIQEIDQDDLIKALEEMVSIFDDKVEPFAFELIQHLNESFKRAVKNTEDRSGENVYSAGS